MCRVFYLGAGSVVGRHSVFTDMVTQPLSASSKVAQIAHFTGDIPKAFNVYSFF
jgi:hypothetical protein